MRLHIIFSTENDRVLLPWHYPVQLQGLLYRWLKAHDGKLARFLHNTGFVIQGHCYKLYVFSHLRGSHAQARPDGVVLSPPLQWWISSPLDVVIETIVAGLFGRPYVRLGQERLFVERVEVERPPDFQQGTLNFRTLSPLVVSTAYHSRNGLVKEFLHPEHPDFGRVLSENLGRKASLLGITASSSDLALTPHSLRSRLFQVHGTNVRGWEGGFRMDGSPELLWLAYEAGLGERNGQGFGMVAVAPSRENPTPRGATFKRDAPSGGLDARTCRH